MAELTRRIGLSLGADICWPIAYEQILSRLDPKVELGGDRLSFEVERVTIEPFDLRQPCRYDVVIDRLTHWYRTSREWIKKSIVMDGLYVFNNPWSLQSMEKATTYAAMMHLGMPVPDTWLIPPKAYEPTDDLQPTLERYAKLFDLEAIGAHLGYPVFMKPYDGGGWLGVSRIEDGETLQSAYEESGTKVMHIQASVLPYDKFVRSIGLGPQVRMVNYDPSAALHDRYKVDFDFLDADETKLLREMTLTINTFFGWDFNSCEALLKEGVFHPIDFANPCPDSQVTSLHFHFPWLIKANIRWSLYCAATKRPMRKTLDWEPYEAIRAQELPYREALRAYGAIAEERLDTERFVEFCNAHLQDLDEVAWEFFGTEIAKDAIRQKVTALFPEHEVDEFTEHFWGMIKFWRKTEEERIAKRPDRPEGV